MPSDSNSQPLLTDEETFETDDLALVTYLDMNGCRWDDMERRGKKCVWLYCRSMPNGDLDQLVVTYAGGGARVEPKSFMIKVGEVRSGMYSFLDGAAA